MPHRSLDCVGGSPCGRGVPEACQAQGTESRRLTLLWVPVQFLTLYGLIWYAPRADHLGTLELIGLFVGVGVLTGTIGINGYLPSIGSPFGGVKASGLGREFSAETLSGYQQIKSTYVMG